MNRFSPRDLGLAFFGLALQALGCTQVHERDSLEDSEPSGAVGDCADASPSCVGDHSDGGSPAVGGDSGASADSGPASNRPDDAGEAGGQMGRDAGATGSRSDAGSNAATSDAGGARDAGTRADSGADDGGSALCRPADCRDQPVPGVACPDGGPVVSCERGADDGCRLRASCDERRACESLGEGCGSGEFCNVERELGGRGCDDLLGGAGFCTARPSACTDEDAPVCGCDYQTYANACEAHTVGASVMLQGSCADTLCRVLGGRPADSSGAGAPSCRAGEDAYPLPEIELAICCVPSPPGGMPGP